MWKPAQCRLRFAGCFDLPAVPDAKKSGMQMQAAYAHMNAAASGKERRSTYLLIPSASIMVR